MLTAYERILAYNQGRFPELVARKLHNMRQNSFLFYRGSCHLFFEDLKTMSGFLPESPPAWICGDLHLENFGSYKADNRLVYFDINDFDESALAPCLWEIGRLLVSIFIEGEHLPRTTTTASFLASHFLNVYSQTLAEGHARLVQEETSEGIVKALFQKRRKRKRKKFIDQRTIFSKKKRVLWIDNERVMALDEETRQKVKTVVNKWAEQKPNSEFYQVMDVGRRIAGTGSLGLERYVLLVKGLGEKDRYLLDLKIAQKSSLSPYLTLPQPNWPNEAMRIIETQKKMQAFPLALLAPVQMDNKWFVIKELQPTQDKVSLEASHHDAGLLNGYMKTMAEVTAWAQLRSSGRQGSASADELIDFGATESWKEPLLNFAKEYAKKVEEDYNKYCKWYDGQLP